MPWEHCILFDFPEDKNVPISERAQTTEQKNMIPLKVNFMKTISYEKGVGEGLFTGVWANYELLLHWKKPLYPQL